MTEEPVRRQVHEPGAWQAGDAGKPARRLSFRGLLNLHGAWGLADQALTSLGNFLTALVLVQTMPKEEFGIFFLVFGMLLFVNSLHQSLVVYPLSVRGAAGDADELRRRAGHSLILTMLLSPVLSLGVIILLGAEYRVALIPWALGAMLLWQVQETFRRALMAHLRHREAVLGDGLSYLGQAAVIFLLAQAQSLTLETAFIAMAATSLLGLLVQARQLGSGFPLIGSLRVVLREHWVLGRWMLLTSAITPFAIQAVPWTLGYFHGMGKVAEFGALAQVMGMTNPILIGVAGLIVPAVAASMRRGMAEARRAALSYGLQGGALLLPYVAAVLLAPEAAIRIVTLKEEYVGLGTELQLVALAWALLLPAQVAQAFLNGLGRTRSSFAAQCAFSATTVLVSLPLTAAYGLTGAAWAGVLPAAVFAGTAMFMVRRASRAMAEEVRRNAMGGLPAQSVKTVPGGVAAE